MTYKNSSFLQCQEKFIIVDPFLVWICNFIPFILLSTIALWWWQKVGKEWKIIERELNGNFITFLWYIFIIISCFWLFHHQHEENKKVFFLLIITKWYKKAIPDFIWQCLESRECKSKYQEKMWPHKTMTIIKRLRTIITKGCVMP